MMMKEYGDVDVHVVHNDDGGDAKEVIQSSTSLSRGNQVDGLPRVCSYFTWAYSSQTGRR